MSRMHAFERILLTLIGWPEDEMIGPPGPARGTREELLAKLVRLSGEDFGEDLEKWVAWWYAKHPDRAGFFDPIVEDDEYIDDDSDSPLDAAEDILRTLVEPLGYFDDPFVLDTREDFFKKLVNLTGQDFGDNLRNWVAWWRATHPDRIDYFSDFFNGEEPKS